MSQTADPITAVGLPGNEIAAWRQAEPALTPDDSVPEAAVRAGRYFEMGNDLLQRLPAKPNRSDAEAEAADRLLEAMRGTRQRFLRYFAGEIYRELTGDYRQFVRADELVYQAAERYPGLSPTREQIERERTLIQKEKEGWEIDQGIFFAHILSHRRAGLHLIHAMLRPTKDAGELLPQFQSEGSLDLGPVTVERTGNVGHVTLRNRPYLNAEDDTTVHPAEIAVDLVLLDPAIEVGVIRGGVVEHPKYAGRRVFSAGINLTHLYHGQISFVDFFLVRDLGFVNKLCRGLTGDEFWPDEPESTLEKPWIAAVEAFAIGGGCQLLLAVDRVIAEEGSYFNLPARKEGIIPGAGNLRMTRFVGDRMARQGILFERSFEAGTPEGSLICDEVVPRGEMDAAIERATAMLSGSGVVSAAANRKALRVQQEPLDIFREYMAVYAQEQARCHYSPALIRNLEKYWQAHQRTLKGRS